jgi:hypothetical protein
MPQSVSRWSFTAEVRVRAQVSPCGIVVDEVALGRFLFEFFGFPSASHHSTNAPYLSVTDP